MASSFGILRQEEGGCHGQNGKPMVAPTRAFSPGRAQYCASRTCQVAEAQYCASARFRVVIHPGPHGENRGADGPVGTGLDWQKPAVGANRLVPTASSAPRAGGARAVQ